MHPPIRAKWDTVVTNPKFGSYAARTYGGSPQTWASAFTGTASLSATGTVAATLVGAAGAGTLTKTSMANSILIGNVEVAAAATTVAGLSSSAQC
jgi:hypothetical protein